MGAKWPDKVRRVKEGGGFQGGLHPGREVGPLIGGHRQLLDGLGPGRRALDIGPTAFVDHVVFGSFEEMGGQLARLLFDLLRGQVDGGPVDREAAAAIGVHSHRTNRGVAVNDLDVLERQAKDVGRDLGERRLMTLAMRGAADDQLGLAGKPHPQDGTAPESDAGCGHGWPGGPDAADLDVRGEADAKVSALLAQLGLLFAQVLIADHSERLVERGGVVTGVVDQPD